MEHLSTKEKQIDDQWEHKKSLTSRPGREKDDVHGLIAARQVDDQRGQPSVAPRSNTHREAEEEHHDAHPTGQLAPQIKHGSPGELKRCPGVLAEAPIIACLHVPDLPRRRL